MQTILKDDCKVTLFAQNDLLSGALGFINCLRREPGGSNVALVVTTGDAPKFDVNDPFYSEQLEKGIAINVLENGKWGTYRHLLMEEAGLVEREHMFGNNTVRGDLSSLKWIEGPLNSESIMDLERTLVYVSTMT